MEGLSWLESLPHHSIFTDTSRSLARSSSINDSTFTLPSPDASTIHGGTSFATLPNGHGKATESGSNGEARRQPQLSVVARKSDLLYAVGSEVRIASLAGYKAKVESQSYGQAQGSSSGASASAGSYKVSRTRHVKRQPPAMLTPGLATLLDMLSSDSEPSGSRLPDQVASPFARLQVLCCHWRQPACCV